MNLDWENRVLCSDGNCIGVIGTDGRCKECGKPYEGKLPENVTAQTPSATIDEPPQPESEPADVHVSADTAEDTAEKPAGDDEWEKRVLCSDGNCIGVIGADGRCKECGKPRAADSSQ